MNKKGRAYISKRVVSIPVLKGWKVAERNGVVITLGGQPVMEPDIEYVKIQMGNVRVVR